MTLSCTCDYDPEPGDILWWHPNDYSVLDTIRAKRCACCGSRIVPGALVAKFVRWKVPDCAIEISIYGEESDCGPPRAPHYLCEGCADQWFNLDELGFCFDYTKTLDALSDYQEMAPR